MMDYIEIGLTDDKNFLKIKETLSRIGIASKKEKKLYQTCHILHKQGLFFIVHFKELFILDGKDVNFTDNDIARRNTIAILLEKWGLLRIATPTVLLNKVYPFAVNTVPINQIKIIRFEDKKNWTLIEKYTFGKKR